MSGVILLLLVPTVILYTYFSRSSIEVIDKQMSANNESQLLFLKSQIESHAERLSFSSSVLTRDSSLLDLQISTLTKDYYQMINYQTQLKEKMLLQSLSSNWTNELSVYLPETQTRVSTNPAKTYDWSGLDRKDNGIWRFKPGNGNEPPYYQLFIWDPFLPGNGVQQDNAVFEVRFSLDNIRKMLQHYKLESPGSCFLLTGSGEVFSHTEAGDGRFKELGTVLLQKGMEAIGHLSLQVEEQNVYLSYAHIPGLDAWLVDYVPLNVFHAPIIKNRNLFYMSMMLLIVLGFISSYMLYLHVQKPISFIVRGLKHFEMGDYSFRINRKFHNEFDYMMLRFNEMGNEIQHLILNVYEEQKRSRLATLKQLQSQINPHFLYNCLSFIAACAKSGQTGTIKEMTYHLGGYYRYTTRVEKQMPLVKEEVELVRHYLQIYSFRLERLDYAIDIPEEMMNEPVMRLILQPVVENAIVHGIEPKPGRGQILITGRQEPEWNVIQVEDSGIGMTGNEIRDYMLRLDQPMDETMGCGLWNVHQRLDQRFGPGAGVLLAPSERLSGICVFLRWRREENEA
jgi:two-component system sensor histidine kinase YesM